MGKLILKINIARSNKLTTQEFDTQMTIFDVCRQIREKVPDSVEPGDDVNEYGLLKINELEPRFGTWLELKRNLEFYQLEYDTILDYRTKMRPLRVDTMDMAILTIIVDDSLNLRDLVEKVCAKYGANNPEEFSFTRIVKRQSQRFGNDDELKWLSSDKSLRDQGVDEKEVVVLRKRYYFTDKNVDENDPVQLGLLYVQSQKDIVEGTHPCTKDEAVKFASLQQQIVSGDFNEEKHKPPIIIKVLPNILPKEYAKTRGIERLVSQEWKHYYGLKEMDAKFRFIQLCRALKTYGVTFFLVKETNMFWDRRILLGITRDSIMRVDEITKNVMTTWPLTTVKKWIDSVNLFTLDFGKYHNSLYSAQTSEGKKISQLIAGYIDIILKKKQASEKFIHDADEEATMFEVNITPQRATPVQIDQSKMDPPYITKDGSYNSTDFYRPDMATTKTYNEVDCKEQLLYIEIEKGEYGGYRQGLLANNLNEVEIDFYICTKCNGLLRNACIVGADQNLACETCVVKGETFLPMIKSRKKIPEISAKCPLASRGCVWRRIIGEVDAHLNECTELVVNCSNKCQVILKRSELTNHCENECPNRKVNCMHCNDIMLHKELHNHLNTCPELPLLCPNEFMETFPRKEMNIEKKCPKRKILNSM